MLYPVHYEKVCQPKLDSLKSKLEKASARREIQELKKIQKAKDGYTKHFTGSLEKERKTCGDPFVFLVGKRMLPIDKDEESISEETKVKAQSLLSKQAKAAARREEANQKKIQSARRFIKPVSHEENSWERLLCQDKVKEPHQFGGLIPKCNFNPTYDAQEACKHTVIRVRTSFDETPVKGAQKCKVSLQKPKNDVFTQTFNKELNKISPKAKKVVHKNGSVAFEISRDSPKIVDDHIPKKQ